MLKKITDFNYKFLSYAVVICLFSMFFLVVFQVFLRFVLQTGFGWTEEVSRYLMIWAVFLGGALAFKKGAHVSMDLITSKLKGNKSRILKIFSLFLVLIFLVILGKESVYLITRMRQLTPALQISYKIIYAVIPISCYFMILQVSSDLFENIKNK